MLTRPPAWTRRASLAVPILALSLAAAACGGGTTSQAPTQAPTGAPTPTSAPSPTTDVAAAFKAIVGDPKFSARFDVDGTIEMGVTVKMTGTIEGSGGDSHQTTAIEVAGTTTTSESIKVGSKSWKRTLPGPWLEQPASAADDKTLTTWLRTLSTIEDVGVETKGGVALHHLRPAGGSQIPPDALGLDASTFKDPQVSIEFYAKDDGTPALFAITGKWVQKISGQDFTVEFTMDLTAKDVGSTITIAAPTDVWTPYTSTLGYTVAHPDGFTVVPASTGDTYQEAGADWFYVTPYTEGKGMTAAGFRDALLDSYASQPGPPRATPAKVTLAGGEAWRMTFDGKASDGSDVVIVDVVTVHGNLGWEVSLITTPSQEAADLAIFDAFLASFSFTK